MEARHGKLWEQGLQGIEAYNRMAKIEPLQKALSGLGARAWLAGLRRAQATTREALPVVGLQDGRIKIHPIVDWTDRDVHAYLEGQDLPYHPLWHEGYLSIGDVHTSRPVGAGLSEEDTRFFGLKRECGIHEEGANGSGI
jgi:phosphoadenosine phosphosulfate reductase